MGGSCTCTIVPYTHQTTLTETWHTPSLFVRLGPLSSEAREHAREQEGHSREPIYALAPSPRYSRSPSWSVRRRLQPKQGSRRQRHVLRRLREARVQGSRRRVAHLRRLQEHHRDDAARRVRHRSRQGRLGGQEARASKRKQCDDLRAKLCADLGENTQTCEMVKRRPRTFQPERCDMMMQHYTEVLADLKKQEEKNKPLAGGEARQDREGRGTRVRSRPTPRSRSWSSRTSSARSARARRDVAHKVKEKYSRQGPLRVPSVPALVPPERARGCRGRAGRATRRASSGSSTTSCSPNQKALDPPGAREVRQGDRPERRRPSRRRSTTRPTPPRWTPR